MATADRAPRGRSFVDVGCMWRVSGAYAFHAADHGATSVTGIDVEPATPEFLATNATRAQPIRFARGDLNDPALATWAGRHDVVFCAGAVSLPNPILSLEQLRSLCHETLILATASLPERETPNLAVLLPGLDDDARRAFTFGTARRKPGLDSDFDAAAGYANWVWLPTPSCVRAMVALAGLEIVEFYPT